jgi:ParB family chromosome partitioning protein
MLKLSDYAKEKLLENKITFGHAKNIVNLDADTQKKIVDTIIGQKLSAREVEHLARSYKPKKTKQKNEENDELSNIIKEIQEKYSLNIKKKDKSIIINVTSKKDLKKIRKIFDI